MHRSGAVMAWNVFKFCTALRGLGSIMILLVLAIIGVTYYAVVLCNYGPALFSAISGSAAGGAVGPITALLVLLLFHALLAMLLWSYFSVVLTDPGSVPPNWRPPVDEERGETSPLTGPEFASQPLQPGPLNDTGAPRVRYCRKCNNLKPPRCHHCSVCEPIFSLEDEFVIFCRITDIILFSVKRKECMPFLVLTEATLVSGCFNKRVGQYFRDIEGGTRGKTIRKMCLQSRS